MFRYLRQSRISEKNVLRLERLSRSSNRRIAGLASLVLEIALVKPHKRRRLKVLARKRPELLAKLEETGLVFAHHW